MFTAETIAAAFVLMTFPIFLASALDKRGHIRIATPIYWIMLISAAYCVAAGLHMLVGWEDPFASVDPQRVTDASEGRRGGLVILAIRFWPYVLIGFGGFVVYNIGLLLWKSR